MSIGAPITLQARVHDLGGIPVRRVLPDRHCRAVGPFVFFDHFGPATAEMQVATHPHIGLSTLTWLLSGTVRHQDSLGNDQWIEPGDVNWMTAGRGIVHSERAASDRRRPLHGIQCWVAQPVALEQGDPAFVHLPGRELPRFSQEGIEWTLGVGHWLEEHSPLDIYWPTFFVEGRVEITGHWQWPYPACWALGVYVIAGHLTVHWHDGSRTALSAGEMAAFPPPGDEAHPTVDARAGTQFICFGGEPLPEPRFFDWNFVASNRELLAEARSRWIARQFPAVPGDSECIPHPSEAERSDAG